MKLIIFTESTGRFQYVVKETYLKICSVPEEEDHYYHATKKIADYLHNEEGPAILDKETRCGFYFLNGDYLTEKGWQHKLYNIKLQNIVGE